VARATEAVRNGSQWFPPPYEGGGQEGVESSGATPL
jgi:hypothetical protein